MNAITLTTAEFDRLRPLFYHGVGPDTMNTMAALRREYVLLALNVLRGQAPSRSQSLALTHLEDSLMRAIQALALTGQPQLPLGFVVEEPTP